MIPKDGKCDSCEEQADALWPVALLVETPYGDEMVEKWYCYGCMSILWSEFGGEEEDDEKPKRMPPWWQRPGPIIFVESIDADILLDDTKFEGL